MELHERTINEHETVKAVRGRCKLIAQVGCVRTDDSVALAKAAARDLQIADASVTEVAKRYGFSSPQHFATTFKRIMGVSPTAPPRPKVFFKFTPLCGGRKFAIISNFTAETVNKVAAYHTSFDGDWFHSRPFFKRKGIGK